MMRTLIPGTLTILSAYPDPPFDVMKDGIATGFDVELMRAVCRRLSLELRPLSYEGENFDDIFAGLAQGTCDAVISGTTITPERAAIVRFSRPYLQFNQGIAVNRRLRPHVSSTADLRGLTAGIQKGNTSDGGQLARGLGQEVQRADDFMMPHSLIVSYVEFFLKALHAARQSR
jgi:polar amino acid transport system substrate-binding protein